MKRTFGARSALWCHALVLLAFTDAAPRLAAVSAVPTVVLQARDTISAVELDHGESATFQLRNGQVRRLELLDTGSELVLTNLKKLKTNQADGGTLYTMTCRLRIDGHELTLRRFVGSQESFYEPIVVNGLRIWLDCVGALDRWVNFGHGAKKPAKAARFALQDASLRVCPAELLPWYPETVPFLDIANSYTGADCWLGALTGRETHGGLDINQPAGTPVLAPLDFDDQFYFNSLAGGETNNRWRGLHRWPNGDLWTLQVHHILTPLVPEHTPVRAGTVIAIGAGMLVGAREHSHYNFAVTPAGGETTYTLDPWIIYLQLFEDLRSRRGDLRVAMAPVGPGTVGQPVAFSSRGSRPGLRRDRLKYTWTFGDGAASHAEHPSHVFTAPGLYPVTLVIDDGGTCATSTHHVTIDGAPLARPALALAAESVSFRERPAGVMDVYGVPVRLLPRTLSFLARPSRPQPDAQIVRLVNRGGGVLPATTNRIEYLDGGDGWLHVELAGQGNAQVATVRVDGTGRPGARYRARVTLMCPDTIDGSQPFWVEMTVPFYPPVHRSLGNVAFVRVDDADITGAFYATPWYWVGHRFALWPGPRGHRGFALTNGGRNVPGEFARFTPDLAAGRYAVEFEPDTPFAEGSRFAVRVRHRQEDEAIWVEPARSRHIGVFDFDEGTDGFVEVLADGATGPVVVDAVRFTPLPNP